MTGQDAANTAKAFNDALPLSGVVLTKIDGDARGGAALSVRHITGKPIKFIGSGEKTDALEAFHPDRIASRILGMGDILSLVEQAQEKVDQDKAEKAGAQGQKGQGFRSRGFTRPVCPNGKHGRSFQPGRQAARYGRRFPGDAEPGSYEADETHGRDHRLDDAAGAA